MKGKFWILFLLPPIIFIVFVVAAFFQNRVSKEISIPTRTGTGQVINSGVGDKKLIALTFDACMTYGMEAKLKSGKAKSYYNKPVIDELIKENVPATLFLTGLWAKNYPEVTKNLSENSLFEIANHSYSHPAFTTGCFGLPFIKTSDKEKEFQMSQEILKNLTGKTPNLFRFPGGCYSKSDLELAKKYGLDIVGWNIASGDAFNKNPKSIVTRVENKAKSGSIVVFHMNGDIDAPETANALPEIISFLKSQGYTFVKVSDLIKK